MVRRFSTRPCARICCVAEFKAIIKVTFERPRCAGIAMVAHIISDLVDLVPIGGPCRKRLQVVE